MWPLWIITLLIFLLLHKKYQLPLLRHAQCISLFTFCASLFLHNTLLECLFCLGITLIIITFYLSSMHKPFYLTSKQLLGKQGTVTHTIGSNYFDKGYVRLDNETWPAITPDMQPIKKGSLVHIHSIDGMILSVSPLPLHTPSMQKEELLET